MTISTNTLAHIRFGYGFRPNSPAIDGAQGLLAQLSAAQGGGLKIDVAGRRDFLKRYRMTSRMERKGEASKEEVKAINVEIAKLIQSDFRRALIKQVTSPAAFTERLVAFWADHFTVSARGRLLSMLRDAFVQEAIRSNVAGNFGDMLIASTTHAAMLVYLDQNSSIGPNSMAGLDRNKGLNENLAREILELHTLGVGSGYGQADVTQFAELLTGIRLTEQGVRYMPRFAEPGAETVLGVTYGGRRGNMEDVEAALRDIAMRPETAQHLARKLAVHFVQDQPDEALIDHVAAAYLASGGELKATYEAFLEHPAAWVPDLRKVKQPRDYVVSSLRAFGFDAGFLNGLTGKEMRDGIARPLTSMGQVPNRPLGPDGWPEEGEAWITPATLSARIEWATELARRFGQDLDPRAFLETALADAASQNTSFLVAGSEAKWEGVALCLASPEFNRR